MLGQAHMHPNLQIRGNILNYFMSNHHLPWNIFAKFTPLREGIGIVPTFHKLNLGRGNILVKEDVLKTIEEYLNEFMCHCHTVLFFTRPVPKGHCVCSTILLNYEPSSYFHSDLNNKLRFYFSLAIIQS